MTSISELISSQSSALPAHWVRQWLLFVLKKSPTFLYSDGDYTPNKDELSLFFDGIARMNQGVPLAYLTHSADFWSLSFYVNEHTLMPRPDTECLVETALTYIKKQAPHPKRLLDLGTGSGCIAISLAKELPTWQVYAVERSPLALEVAKTNAKTHGADIHFFYGDWFCPLPSVTFSLIVANPPYLAKDDRHLPALQSEPISALVAEADGLADIAHIIDQSRLFLHDNGMLIIEHGYDQAQRVQALFAQANFCHIHTIKDYGGNERLTCGSFCATMTI